MNTNNNDITKSDDIKILNLDEQNKLAYLMHQSTVVNAPTIVFLGGFMSDMEGTKALHLHELCSRNDYNFIRFDYLGHGKSSGEFTKGTISLWVSNVIRVIDELTTRKVILVGSSMGGWLMLLATLKRSEKIAGLIGIAAAPDFTKTLLWDIFSEDQKREIEEKGVIDFATSPESSFPISIKLIEDGNNNLLLNQAININCPVHLIHGMQDKEVPYNVAIELSEKLSSQDVEISLIKSAGHRLSEPENLSLLEQAFRKK